MPAHIVDLNDWQPDVWPSTPEGEERQSKEWENLYRILFEHPLIEAVTGWDFADGMWLNAPSGVIYKDNTVKPVYKMLHKLFKEEWWTDEEVCTDENGMVYVEGFKGDYILKNGEREASFDLRTSEEEVLTVVL